MLLQVVLVTERSDLALQKNNACQVCYVSLGEQLAAGQVLRC